MSTLSRRRVRRRRRRPQQPPEKRKLSSGLPAISNVVVAGKKTEPYVDPFRTRIGDRPLLDFMYNDTVIRRGIRNMVTPEHFEENIGEFAAMGALAARLEELYGQHSITYGYISPMLSREIVSSYRDPDAPSYHRFDAGAAADFVFHDMLECGHITQSDDPDEGSIVYYSPHEVAHMLCGAIPEMLSRVITYSESAGICVATSSDEEILARKNLYFNVFAGRQKEKPVFLRDSIKSRNVFEKKVRALVKKHGWQGPRGSNGWPSYHGRGRRQAHHIRLGRYVLLSDLLRTPQMLTEGHRNPAPKNTEEGRRIRGNLYKLAEALSEFIALYSVRVTSPDYFEESDDPLLYAPHITIAGGLNSEPSIISPDWGYTVHSRGYFNLSEGTAAILAIPIHAYNDDVFDDSLVDAGLRCHPDMSFKGAPPDGIVYLLVSLEDQP